jgi:hypothetical protein
VDVQRSLIKLQLHSVVGDIGQGEAGFAAHPGNAVAEADFRPGIHVGPHAVRSRQRTVHIRKRPVFHSARLE